MSSTVTLSQTERQSPPSVAEKQLAPAPAQVAFFNAACDTGLFLGMTLVSPIVLMAIFVLALSKSVTSAFKTSLRL